MPGDSIVLSIAIRAITLCRKHCAAVLIRSAALRPKVTTTHRRHVRLLEVRHGLRVPPLSILHHQSEFRMVGINRKIDARRTLGREASSKEVEAVPALRV